jgi:hypothetical protein
LVLWKTTSSALAVNGDIVLIGDIIVQVKRDGWIIIGVELKLSKEITERRSIVDDFSENWANEFSKGNLSFVSDLTVA